MSEGRFTIEVIEGRINFKCDKCEEFMEAPQSRMGARLADAFWKQHECPEPTRYEEGKLATF